VRLKEGRKKAEKKPRPAVSHLAKNGACLYNTLRDCALIARKIKETPKVTKGKPRQKHDFSRGGSPGRE